MVGPWKMSDENSINHKPNRILTYKKEIDIQSSISLPSTINPIRINSFLSLTEGERIFLSLSRSFCFLLPGTSSLSLSLFGYFLSLYSLFKVPSATWIKLPLEDFCIFISPCLRTMKAQLQPWDRMSLWCMCELSSPLQNSSLLTPPTIFQTSKFSFKHVFRISVFHRGSASGIYRTLLWWVVLYLPFIYQSERLRCGFGSLIYIFVLVAWNGFWKWFFFFFFRSSLASYLFTKFWFLLVLRSVGSWIWVFIYQFIVSLGEVSSCCAGIVINVRPISTVDHLNS